MLAVLTAALLAVAPSSPPMVSATADVRPPLVGVLVDAGAPDGVGVSLVANLGTFFRLHAGGLSNGIGFGVRAGATAYAFPASIVRPIISGDVGYTWGGQGLWLLELISDPAIKSALSNVNGYFFNLHTGLEIGNRSVSLAIKVGISYVDLDLGAQTLSLGQGTSISAGVTMFRGFFPSAKLGLLFNIG